MSHNHSYVHDHDLSCKPPRRGAVDFTAGGKVRSDYWHKNMPSEAVSRNHSQFPGIHFFPIDGVGAGVAMTECEYTEGIAMPAQSIFDHLPSHLRSIESGVFVITVSPNLVHAFSLTHERLQWPGYQHLKWKHNIVFVHSNGVPLTISHMASQIACLWRQFYEVSFCRAWNSRNTQLINHFQKHKRDFSGCGLHLGTNDISFNHLRLHQIYTNDGRHWQAEVSYIKA